MNPGSKASNVLLARCRARYGRRLTAQDIETLISCRTMSECADCLRSTRYADALSGLEDGSMRRRTVEAALSDHLMNELYSLCRCEQSVGDWFGDYILMRAEIRQIMSFMYLLASGRQQESILSVPEFILRRSHIDSAEFAACTTYDDLLRAMRHSRFARVVRAMRPLPGNRPDCARIEHALYAELYREVKEIINRHSGKVREELNDIIGTQLDMLNFRTIYRLKKYYEATPAEVRSMLFSCEHRIRHSVLQDMINAPDADSVLSIFIGRTPYGRQLDRELVDSGGFETATQLLVQSRARRLMRSSINPATVLLAYVVMAEAEVHDLTVIVESIFYGLPREEILSLITIDNLAG